jgi:23S rRNA pseudouridine1911/1915/1917 synthase
VNDREYIFDLPFSPGRLDSVLVSQLSDLSRTRVQHLIRQGRVRVDGEVIVKPSFTLQGSERLQIEIPQVRETNLIPEDIPLDIIYEDRNLLVVDKQAGMVVHPSAGHRSGTLVNAVLAHSPDIEGVGGLKRPGIVHRLDKETSGVILIAKNDHTHKFLQDQFSQRKVGKIYLALVDGIPKTSTGIVETKIGRSKRDRKKMAVLSSGRGREAITHFRILETFDKHAYLEVKPKTGRTHQIRVHMAFIGNPVVGDRVYGRRKPSLTVGRHFLHAAELQIKIPDVAAVQTFTSPLPGELSLHLERLRSAGRVVEN